MEYEPGQQIGPYEIMDRLGTGGMSNVYRARDPEHDRDVVLKFPHEEIMGDVATHERFSREVKIGKLLHHPNIQQLYELATFRGSEYLVLEYVPGESMRRFLRGRSHAPADFALARTMGLQIARALGYAHEHHVAHRDLKPENIIVTPDGQAKVMDFGIAFLKGARRVTWGPLSSQVGTPDYMAPEQIQGGRGDARTDIYALGMILYEQVAGHLPYSGDNALAVMNQHVTAKPPPLHQFRRDVPPALEETIMKAIRRKPEDRWPTMATLIDALEHPESVDVDSLRREREQEPGDLPHVGRLAGRFQMPSSPATLAVLCAVVLLIVLVVLASHFAAPARH
ncbi:MAG: serine/threonine protein kinase [Armatimonadetes bacterium]|nr:serine/threonine protein kinase [Armatimonadota bacterium]